MREWLWRNPFSICNLQRSLKEHLRLFIGRSFYFIWIILLNRPEGDMRVKSEVLKSWSWNEIWVSQWGRRTVVAYTIWIRVQGSVSSPFFLLLPLKFPSCLHYSLHCILSYSRHNSVHTCSEVTGGSEGVGGEEKTSKMCVFRRLVSHYIGVW